jgi:hypothetical protein
MNYIKTPQVGLAVIICLALALIFIFLRPESTAQTSSTFGGRFQLLAPNEGPYVIFDTATARAWRYNPASNLGGGQQPASWSEFSPPFATK